MSRLLQILAIFLVISLVIGCGKSDKETVKKIDVEKPEVNLPADLGKVDFEWSIFKGKEITYYYQPDTSLNTESKKTGIEICRNLLIC